MNSPNQQFGNKYKSDRYGSSRVIQRRNKQTKPNVSIIDEAGMYIDVCIGGIILEKIKSDYSISAHIGYNGFYLKRIFTYLKYELSFPFYR
jgi:hypothetical protein